MTEDTISQIATPRGAGGIGIVRVSGSEALSVACRVFRSAKGRDLREMAPYTACYGHVVRADGTVIDACILLYMRAPHLNSSATAAALCCVRCSFGHGRRGRVRHRRESLQSVHFSADGLTLRVPRA